MNRLLLIISMLLTMACRAADELPQISAKNLGEWQGERQRLLGLFASEMYGRTPEIPVHKVEVKILERSDNALGGKAVRIQCDIILPGLPQPNPFRMLVYLPKTDKPVPVFLGLNFMGNHSINPDPEILIPEWNPKPRPRGARQDRYDLDLILGSGFGLATIHTADIEPDRPDAWKTALRGALHGDGPVKDAEWGTIGMWAWGLSRALDALQSIPEVDGGRIIVWGHSRLGKAALWTGAQDARYFAVISNNSGCCGASLTRHILPDGKSETLFEINKRFPHWFAKNLLKYVDKENTLPFDQHQLLALIAPRPVYVASAVEDVWADPEGEFLSAKYASPVYELYGQKGIDTSAEMPELNKSIGQRVGYHIRSGGHTVTSFDWQCFIDFIKRNRND